MRNIDSHRITILFKAKGSDTMTYEYTNNSRGSRRGNFFVSLSGFMLIFA